MGVVQVNPLTGRPLEPGQALVYGPDWTGPRVTVVTVAAPSSWPRWIQEDAGGDPVDDGETTGGTWQGGAQELPDLVSTAPAPFPWWLALVLLVGGAAAIKARGGKTWA